MVRGDRKLSLIFICLIVFLLVLGNVLATEHDLALPEDTEGSALETTEDTEGSALETTEDTETEEDLGLSLDELSYNWLEKKVTEGPISDIETEVFSIIAFLNEGTRLDVISALVDGLKEKKHDSGCWPKNGCNTKDTALATLAMTLSGQELEASEGIAWLEDAKTTGLSKAGWNLVIKSSGAGGCDVTLGGKTKPYTIEEDQIQGVGSDKYSINLAASFGAALDKLLPELNTDCTGLGGAIISLLYKNDPNTFFIQDSETSPVVDMKIANVCFASKKKGGSCDYDTTLYTTWILVEMGEDLDNIGTNVYLQSQLKPNKAKDLALLNRILFKAGKVAPSFLSDLSGLQGTDRSWDKSVYTTSLALFGLLGSNLQEETEGAIAYLERKRDDKTGDFENNVKSTSVALVALYGGDLISRAVGEPAVPVSGGVASEGSEEICGNLIDDDGDLFADCMDTECEIEFLPLCSNGRLDDCEVDIDCGGFCSACGEESVLRPVSDECSSDFDCDTDETCRSGKCVASAGREPPTPPPTDKGSLWWLWVLIIVLVLGVGGTLFYLIKTGKIKLKKNKGVSFDDYKRQMSTFRPVRPVVQGRPAGGIPARRPAVRPIKEKEEEALEKSIKEAQKLVKGK